MNITTSSRNGRRFGTLLDPMRLFDDLMTWEPAGSQMVWTAMARPVSVDYTAEGVSITVDMPGVHEADLDITFDAGTLSITGRRGDTASSYSVALERVIDPSTLEATLTRGVLTLTAQKRPEAKPRKILVNALQKSLDAGAAK